MSPEVGKILNTLGSEAHRKWLAAASDELLDEYISNIVGNEALHRLGVAERDRRHFKRVLQPHWSVTPNFWVTVIACLAAIGALWFGWRADVRERAREIPASHADFPAAQAQPSSSSSPSNSPALKP